MRIAREKFPAVRVLCGDAETADFGRKFDAIMIYNAFPHFPDPAHMIEALARWIRPGGTLTVESGDDAMHANESIRFEGASLLVPLCVEGIEAQRIDILSGSIDVTAVNDGINANGLSRGVNMSRLAISGGSVKIHAEGDGMDSNGDILISGGTILVSADPSDGNSAVDYGIENGGDCTISGGTIVACGFAGMAEMFSDASDFARRCAEKDVLYVFPYNNPWNWMDPQAIAYTDELPRTVNGKVRRVEIRERDLAAASDRH